MKLKKSLSAVFVVLLMLGSMPLLAYSASADPNTEIIIDDAVSNQALYDFTYRPLFYANGYYWLFYWDSDGSTVYRSSQDGEIWSDPVQFTDFYAEITTWVDGDEVYVVYANWDLSNYPLYYRKGTLGSGTITWVTNAQQVAAGVSDYYSDVGICLDENNYVWIVYSFWTDKRIFVTCSARNDGIWETVDGFPVQLTIQGYSPCVYPISGGVVVTYLDGSYRICAREWNGTAWEDEVNSGIYTATSGQGMSSVCVGDKVFFAAKYDVDFWVFTYYDAQNNEFRGTNYVQPTNYYNRDVVITTNGWKLVVMWYYNGYIYYCNSTDNGGTWGQEVAWLETTNNVRVINAPYRYENTLFVTYRDQEDSLCFVYMPLAQEEPPAVTINDIIVSSTYIEANDDFEIFVSITDRKTVADILNVTIAIGSIKIIWDRENDSFGEIDPNDYAYLHLTRCSAQYNETVNDTIDITVNLFLYEYLASGYYDITVKVLNISLDETIKNVEDAFFFDNTLENVNWCEHFNTTPQDWEFSNTYSEFDIDESQGLLYFEFTRTKFYDQIGKKIMEPYPGSFRLNWTVSIDFTWTYGVARFGALNFNITETNPEDKFLWPEDATGVYFQIYGNYFTNFSVSVVVIENRDEETIHSWGPFEMSEYDDEFITYEIVRVGTTYTYNLYYDGERIGTYSDTGPSFNVSCVAIFNLATYYDQYGLPQHLIGGYVDSVCFATAVKIEDFELPASTHANEYFWINATASYLDGVINEGGTEWNIAYMVLDFSHTAVMVWTFGAEEFDVEKGSEYIFIDAENSSSEILSMNVVRISWRVAVSFAFPSDSVNVYARIYDTDGYSDMYVSMSAFTVKKELRVVDAGVSDTRVNPGQSITFTGQVVYNDTLTPPEIASGISVGIYIGEERAGSGGIRSDGSYSITISAPSSVGAYAYGTLASTAYGDAGAPEIEVVVDAFTILDIQVDVLNDTITIEVARAYDETVPEGSVFRFGGVNAEVDSEGRASFNMSLRDAVQWGSRISVQEDEYGITHILDNQGVPYHKVKIGEFVVRSGARISDPSVRTLTTSEFAVRELVFDATGIACVKGSSTGAPLKLLVNGDQYDNWTYDSDTDTVIITDLGSKVLIWYRYVPSSGGGNMPGGGGNTPVPPESDGESEPEPTTGSDDSGRRGGGLWNLLNTTELTTTKAAFWGLLILLLVMIFSRIMRRRE